MTDIRHYFMEKGEGKPLILLHGNAERRSFYSRQKTGGFQSGSPGFFTQIKNFLIRRIYNAKEEMI